MLSVFKIVIQLERLAVLICEWIIELMVIALLFIQSPGHGCFFVAFQTYNLLFYFQRV